MINNQQKKKLFEILRKDFGLDISEKEAFEIGQNLINFFEILIKEEYEKNNKKD